MFLRAVAQINFFHGRSQYIFIESICNDSQVRGCRLHGWPVAWRLGLGFRGVSCSHGGCYQAAVPLGGIHTLCCLQYTKSMALPVHVERHVFCALLCCAEQVLEDNYRYKMKYSPDYQGVDTEAVSNDDVLHARPLFLCD